ncbi:RNA polymerase sigma factor [Paenibacillus soyae]|uniref:RNA polymerase sigma factor n=1 Tax=Paenibacillus soyae TaxID=2969249 RepID=A0A9X2SBL1_9BACL|nr:sigma-70 family RNA polymerase sigma factor [Paenibacillus soyae]MCR2805763.1 sigma-70 family RNA polymerase sigma factor [Paenibacillus soyae]
MAEAVTEELALIERARSGDQAAFGELVRKHRAKAFEWAKRIARDPHMAEDILQEALLRAFLHLGTLADMERFLPWLHRIVRNEALMKLRKAEHAGKERTFTALATVRDAGQVAWHDVDSILHYMASRRDEGNEPERRLAQKEFLVTLRHLLRCLTAKERAVFEAHFFEQLSPSEIACLFGTTTDNVYQSLSRARLKVKEERIRLRLQDYVREQRDEAMPAKAVVALRKGPGSAEWRRCKTSFAGAVCAVIPYAGEVKRSLIDVMGLTAQAFRLTIEEERVDASGPAMYFWENKFRDGLLNLGFESAHAGDGGAPPTPFLLNEAIAHARRSIARGVPAIAWDVGAPEFGIVYGYDDEEQVLYAEDAKGKHVLPYDRFGRGESGGVFVLAVTEPKPIGEREAIANALDMAVRHAYGELTFVGYVCGLPAYDCWMEAFRKRRVDRIGNAYTAQIAADARGYAARFLRDVGAKFEDAAALALEAAGHYETAAENLERMTERFPFPAGGQPDDPAVAEEAIHLLKRASAAEESGVRALRRLAGRLRENGTYLQ